MTTPTNLQQPTGPSVNQPTVVSNSPGTQTTPGCKGSIKVPTPFGDISIPPGPGTKWCENRLGYLPYREDWPCPGNYTEVPCSGSNPLNTPETRALQTPGSGAPIVSGLPNLPNPTTWAQQLAKKISGPADWLSSPAHWKGIGLLAFAVVGAAIGLVMWAFGNDPVEKVARVTPIGRAAAARARSA
jgi:hypothetical protein